jgi:serine/threonine-protein kinase
MEMGRRIDHVGLWIRVERPFHEPMPPAVPPRLVKPPVPRRPPPPVARSVPAQRVALAPTPSRDTPLLDEAKTVVDGRYVLVRELARGGVGVVFEARHRYTGRNVAIKLLMDDRRDAECRARLLREARALGLAKHPNVVDLLDAGDTETDGPYLVMEMLHGRTLEGLLASRGTLTVPEAARLGRELCHALSGAHRAGVVHRDIKPNNVFVALSASGHERVTLFDFGIASVLDDAPPSEELNRKLTQQGEVLGTPEYMAPERLLAQSGRDSRSDVYAVGVTLYECLTGVVPYEGNYGEVLLKRSTTPVPSLRARRPDVPVELEALILKALEADVGARIASAAELGAGLAGFATGPESPRGLLGVRQEPGSTEPSRAAKPPPLPGDSPRREEPRRRHARAPYLTPVRIVRSGDRSVDGNSEDVSEGGLLVFTPWPCDNGEQVDVRFALPLSGRIVTVKATARWIRTARRSGATGLEFIDVPKSARQEIADYVRAMGAA